VDTVQSQNSLVVFKTNWNRNYTYNNNNNIIFKMMFHVEPKELQILM
jgi:hypothetical protein